MASRLLVKLGAFLEGNPLGEALMETLVRLPAPPGRNRRPDVAFVSAAKAAHAKAKRVDIRFMEYLVARSSF